MSTAQSEPDWESVIERAMQRPLEHPMASSLVLHSYETLPPEHIRDIYDAAYRSLTNDDNAANNILRILPREHGKSEAASHVIPAWNSLRDPDQRTLIMSETEGQAKKKLSQVRETIEDHAPRFGHEIVENTKLTLELDREANHSDPTVEAAGFSSGVTGGHYDLIVYDDIVSWKTQRTSSRRRKVWQQFQDYQNLGTKGETTFITIGTRKHPKDLYSKLIESPAWDSRIEPAIYDYSVVENGEYAVVTDGGNTYDASEVQDIARRGETIISIEPKRDVPVLWPERWSLPDLILDMLKASIDGSGSLVWKREKQNDARALMGSVLEEQMLSYVDELPDGRLRWYAGVDIGVVEDPEKAATQDSDYWSIAINAHHPDSGVSYIVDVKRARGMSLDKGIKWVKRQTADHPISTYIVESNQAQRWFVQNARDEGLNIEPSTSSGKKEDRIIDMSARFESGRIRLVEDGTDWSGFANEWAQFPSGDHDDRLDAAEISTRLIGREEIDAVDLEMSDLPI